MKNSQKLVFTMLVAVLLLEFGSLTKITTIWGMAFSLDTAGTAQAGGTVPTSTPTNTGVQTQPTTHPTNPVENL